MATVWWREIFETFRVWCTAKYLQTTTCTPDFYFVDLRSGHFRSLPILSQWEETQVPHILIRFVQFAQNHAQLGYHWWLRYNFAYLTPVKVIWGHIMTSWGQCKFLLVNFDWIEADMDWCQNVRLVPIWIVPTWNDVQHNILIGCPRIIRTCIFPQLSVLRWNHWRCGYQNFLKYSSKGKGKCHTPPKSPHDHVQSLFPVSAEDLLFPLCSRTKQAIIDKGRIHRFHNRAVDFIFAGGPANEVRN